MSTNDFKRGVEAQAQTHYAFMRKQGEATAELGKRLIKKVNMWGKVINVVVDTLSQLERERIFGISASWDIAALEEHERILLLGYLKALTTRKNQNTAQQNEYFFNVKKYLNISNVDDTIEFTAISKLDVSRSELMAFLECVCEFLFLKNGSRSFLKKFKPELECFGLSDKVIEGVVASIEKTYQFFGLQGIVEHYDLQPLPSKTAEEERKPLVIPFFQRPIFVVYSSRSKHGKKRAELLKTRIHERLDELDLDCRVEIYSGKEAKKEENAFERQGAHIIYIGEPTMSKALSDIVEEWDFDNFGMRYVTRGRQSIIRVTELKEKQYKDFLVYVQERHLPHISKAEENIRGQQDTILNTAFDKDEPLAVNVMVGILGSWLILPSAILDASCKADYKADLKYIQYKIAIDEFLSSKITPYLADRE